MIARDNLRLSILRAVYENKPKIRYGKMAYVSIPMNNSRKSNEIDYADLKPEAKTNNEAKAVEVLKENNPPEIIRKPIDLNNNTTMAVIDSLMAQCIKRKDKHIKENITIVVDEFVDQFGYDRDILYNILKQRLKQFSHDKK